MNNAAVKKQRELLQEIAFKTWNFFEDVTTAKTNFLPPDNIQKGKKFELSPYTSVTNVGFYLISVLTAYRLKFISFTELTSRLQDTIGTLHRLEKHRGLFYSYYDLYSLKASKPYFIPSLDNGNLLACLTSLSEGLKQVSSWYAFDNSLFDGIGVMVRQCRYDNQALSKHSLLKLDEIEKTIEVPVKGLDRVLAALDRVEGLSREVETSHLDELHSLRKTLPRLQGHIHNLIREIQSWRPIISQEQFDEIHSAEVKGFISDIYEAKNSHELYAKVNYLYMLSADTDNLEHLHALLRPSHTRLGKFVEGADQMATDLESYIHAMDFSFFFNQKLKFMSVGYKVTRKRLEPYHYETLASESRLLVYLAVCKSDIPKKAWPILTRKMKKGRNGVFILSWGGTTFEYFMPTLFMKYSKASIYQQTLDTYLFDQQDYAEKLQIPWGISESMYDEINNGGKYKYKAFGFHEAALNPNVDKRKVISPYSTFLALRHDFKGGMKNIERLIYDGCYGEYGFYESIDYTRDENGSVIYAYMSHHQGMILASLCNVLESNLIVKLFHSNKVVKTGEYLLEENKAGPVPPKQVVLKNVKNIVYSH
jgi:cyclic beta-1,2-glucan synthetase